MNYSKGDLLCNYSMTSFLVLHHSLLHQNSTSLSVFLAYSRQSALKMRLLFYILVFCTNNNETHTLQSNFRMKCSFHLLHTPYKLRQRKTHSLAQFSFINDTIRYDTIRYYNIHIAVEFLAMKGNVPYTNI